jgi:hypothetical protein
MSDRCDECGCRLELVHNESLCEHCISYLDGYNAGYRDAERSVTDMLLDVAKRGHTYHVGPENVPVKLGAAVVAMTPAQCVHEMRRLAAAAKLASQGCNPKRRYAAPVARTSPLNPSLVYLSLMHIESVVSNLEVADDEDLG